MVFSTVQKAKGDQCISDSREYSQNGQCAGEYLPNTGKIAIDCNCHAKRSKSKGGNVDSLLVLKNPKDKQSLNNARD